MTEAAPDIEGKDIAPDTLDADMERLVAAGIITPVDLLKVRLDVVTQAAIPEAFMPMVNGAYEHNVRELVAAGKKELTRRTLLEGVGQ